MKKPFDMHRYERHPKSLSRQELDRIRRDYIGTIGGLPVYTMDGEYVRLSLDINYVCGGNPGRYRYCPEKELWVEDTTRPTDLPGVVLHEYVECLLMVQQKMTYDVAHDHASNVEIVLRRAIAEGAFRIRTKRDAVKIADEWFQARVLEP